MVEPQNLVPNLTEMMEEYTTSVEEVHLEPQIETTSMAEPEVQREEQNLAQKRNKKKRTEQSRDKQNEESKDDKAFISDEAYSFWVENLRDKGLIGERGFGKFVSPFAKIIEKKRLEFVLHAQTTWVCCCSQGVLCQHGRDEGRLSIRQRDMGPHGP